MNSQPANHSSRHRLSTGSERLGFTLTELLIVIGIIVLFVTLALPAFNLIGGSKSVAGAENISAALIGRARAEAFGGNTLRGIAFYLDTTTDRYYAAVVSQPSISEWSAATTYTQFAYVTVTTGTATLGALPPPPRYFVATAATGNANQSPPLSSPTYWIETDPYVLDVAADTDVVALPAGVGAEVINNSTMTTSAGRASSGYLPVGVILFGPTGALSFSRVSLAKAGRIGVAANFNANAPFYAAPPHNGFLTAATIAGNTLNTPNQQDGLPLTGAIGVVFFDKQTFNGQGFTSGFPAALTYSSVYPYTLASPYPPASVTYTGSDPLIDNWLDANATPLLVNRANGTLIRSE